MDGRTWVDAALAKACWRAAKHWLTVWAGAGFRATANDQGAVFITNANEFQKKFPDGPVLIEHLRGELVSLIREGNSAVEKDPRLKLESQSAEQKAYLRHLEAVVEGKARHESIVSRACRWLAKDEKADPEDLRRQLDHANKCLARLKSELAAAIRERDELKRRQAKAAA
jgi:hypothetical protein